MDSRSSPDLPDLPPLILHAIEQASMTDDFAQKLEFLRAAMVLESRKNRFLVNWCLAYLGFDMLFLGLSEEDGRERWYDRTFRCEVDNPGSGVKSVMRWIPSLIRWKGGILAIEHPEAGVNEDHLARVTELLVHTTQGLTKEDHKVPWHDDLMRWLKDDCPKEFEQYLPKS